MCEICTSHPCDRCGLDICDSCGEGTNSGEWLCIPCFMNDPNIKSEGEL
ncbi:hypothetical protein LCGC14_0371940 [marine sediment metagenome]|uniref:Uncharacterized protein n=1 Tax=marine sediment metagenome TaxID=412755 RepID=A0A0F9TN40_9ZZZZ